MSTIDKMFAGRKFNQAAQSKDNETNKLDGADAVIASAQDPQPEQEKQPPAQQRQAKKKSQQPELEKVSIQLSKRNHKRLKLESVKQDKFIWQLLEEALNQYFDK